MDEWMEMKGGRSCRRNRRRRWSSRAEPIDGTRKMFYVYVEMKMVFVRENSEPAPRRFKPEGKDNSSEKLIRILKKKIENKTHAFFLS